MWRPVLLSSLLALFVAIYYFLLPNQPVRADSLCVNPGGTDGCFASIQAAVDSASSGDTISIAPGNYTRDASIYITKTLTLQGSGPATVIHSFINPASPVTLTDFTLQTIWTVGMRTDCCGPIILKNLRIQGDNWGIVLFVGSVVAANLSIATPQGILCNMYISTPVSITNSSITTLSILRPTGCSGVVMTNDTFTGSVDLNAGIMTATNTIFAGGCNPAPASPDFGLISQGHNIDASNDCGLNARGDLTNTDPLLGFTRLINGQVVNTLQSISPAINAGDDSQCPTTDATGFPRPYGSHCDIGAYEWRPLEFTFLPFAIK